MELHDIDEIIIAGLTDKKLTEREEKLFQEWYGDADNRVLYEAFLRQQAAAFAGMANEVNTRAAWERIKPRKRKPLIRGTIRYAAVAMVVAMGVTMWFAIEKRQNAAVVEVEPGKFMAILTTGAQKTFLSQADTTATSKNGEIIFSASPEGMIIGDAADDGAISILSVPRGGYYKVSLSDGTLVWLNAESSLRFPARFSGDSRTVDIDGEAYFKVTPNKDQPFIVTTGGYDICVTGTEFNVRNYRDEPISTTLIEGGVKIEHEGNIIDLAPGQQVTLDNGHIRVASVNTDDYTAWQQGSFSFNLERLENIMTELSRWYNIDVIWKNPSLKDMRFSSWFSRDTNIQDIIEILEKTRRVSLRLDNNTLTVSH